MEQVWDNEYTSGKWAYLAGASEAGRYAIIASQLHHFCPGGPILDVGCGEALLRHHIDQTRYAYTGIDISRVAIQRAATRRPSMALIVADAAQFPNYVEAKYHAVIFNEVLYYLPDVPGLLKAYSRLLSGSALVVVSTFLPAANHREWFDRVAKVWEALSCCSWAVLDDCELWNKTSGNRWRITAFNSNGRRNPRL